MFAGNSADEYRREYAAEYIGRESNVEHHFSRVVERALQRLADQTEKAFEKHGEIIKALYEKVQSLEAELEYLRQDQGEKDLGFNE